MDPRCIHCESNGKFDIKIALEVAVLRMYLTELVETNSGPSAQFRGREAFQASCWQLSLIISELCTIEDKLNILRADRWLEQVAELKEQMICLQCAFRRLCSKNFSDADKQDDRAKVNAIISNCEKLGEACNTARKVDIRTIVCEECDKHFPAFPFKAFAARTTGTSQ